MKPPHRQSERDLYSPQSGGSRTGPCCVGSGKWTEQALGQVLVLTIDILDPTVFGAAGWSQGAIEQIADDDCLLS